MHERDLNLLASNEGTPLYLYDLSLLTARVEDIRGHLGDNSADLLFATMANDRPEVIRSLASVGVGACVNSLSHLHLALECGIDRHLIHFTSTGIVKTDLVALKKLGICVNVDSRDQLDTWRSCEGSGRIGLRVNVASLMNLPEGKGDRLGMETSTIEELLAEAELRGQPIDGLHLYAGTNYQTAEDLLRIVRAFLKFAGRFRGLSYVNLGGGIGVNYQHDGTEFDFKHWGQELHAEMKRLPGVRLIIEPGRALVASSCLFVTRVTDVKVLRGKRYVGVDASIAVFPRPFHHPESQHRVSLLRSDCSDAMMSTQVVGRTTFSRDILASCPLPIDTQIGDLLVFQDAGAYCESMRSRFLGQPSPFIVFRNGSVGVPATFLADGVAVA